MNRKSLVSGVAVFLLGFGGGVGAAPVTITESLNFDNASSPLPTGWSLLDLNNRGHNLGFSGGQLYIGQVDTSGGIYRAINGAGLSSISITYDTNITSNYWGQGSQVELVDSLPTLRNASSSSAKLAIAGINKAGYGLSLLHEYGGSQVNGIYTEGVNRNLGLVTGNYRVSATFENGSASNGSASFTVLNLDTNNTNSYSWSMPNFSLSAVNDLFIGGFNTTGAATTIDNVVVTTTMAPPTCTPPQVLQGNACVTPTPKPSDLTLARLSEDVYNRNNAGNRGSPGFNFIAGKSEYIPIRYVAQVPQLVNAGSTPATTTPPVKEDAVAINVYQNVTDPHQYVLAVRGTDNAYDLIADGSFLPGGIPNSELRTYANLLATKISSILAEDSNASITLTGHSMGGAIAQVVGAVGNFDVVSFDAPGVGDTWQSMSSSVATSLATFLGGNYVPRGGTAIVTNYRLYGDQASFAGTPLSNSITKTVQNLASNSVIDDGLLPMGWLDDHAMPTLLTQLERALGQSCVPALCVQIETAAAGAKGPGRNIVDSVIFPAVRAAPILCVLATISDGFVASTGYCGLALLSNRLVQNVVGGVANFIDPGSGWIYSIEFDASSPQVRSISLPLFGDVFGWALRYQDQAGWSSDNILTTEDPFLFLTDIEALTLVPLDAFGNPIYNTDSFIYDLTFEQSGNFSGTQTAYGILREDSTVPEPSTILLALAGLGFLHRRCRAAVVG